MTQMPEQFVGGTLPDAGSNGGVSAVCVKIRFSPEKSGSFRSRCVSVLLSDLFGVLYGLDFAATSTTNRGGQR